MKAPTERLYDTQGSCMRNGRFSATVQALSEGWAVSRPVVKWVYRGHGIQHPAPTKSTHCSFSQWLLSSALGSPQSILLSNKLVTVARQN